MTDTSRTSRTKSPKAFRTISEAAGELDLPQHVLRFWETKFPQIRPMKRAGGRRFYRPEDVDLLVRIKALLHTEGYTIKGVQKLLRQNGSQKQEQTAHPAEQPDEQTVTSTGAEKGDKEALTQNALMTDEITKAIVALESARADLLSVRKSS